MACPYFVPREIADDVSWLHPARLPLGAGWRGECCGGESATTPSNSILHDCCNLGYASACPQLPRERDWDAIRFSVARASAGQISLSYVCELAHSPIESGKLTYDCLRESWLNPHADPRVQRLAASYLHAYRVRSRVSLVVDESGQANERSA